MQKRIAFPLLTTALAIITLLSFLVVLAPIQAAPDSTDVPNSDSDVEHFAAFLDGEQEVPAVSTNASGVARFSLDGTTLAFEVAVREIADITFTWGQQASIALLLAHCTQVRAISIPTTRSVAP